MQMLFVKITGALLTVCGFCFLGIKKSLTLKERYENCNEIIFCINELSSQIALKNGEVPKLTEEIFKKVPESIKENELKNFFENIGMSDNLTAMNKCKIYEKIFFDKKERAKKHYEMYARLYTVGFTLLGVLIVIMLF